MIRKKCLFFGCFVAIIVFSFGVYVIHSQQRTSSAVKIKPLTNRTQREISKELDEKLPEPFKTRRLLLNKRCRSLFTKSARRIIWERFPHHQMLIDTERNFAYCSVEKAGSTFWKSVFAKLAGKLTSDDSDLPDDVKSKDDIHGIFLHKLKNYSRKRATDFLKKAQLMLFVRDPYVRLSSAYMDKLFAPNYIYWPQIGKVVESKIREKESNVLACGHDVTFEEFLQYFVMSESKVSVPSDHHWKPIWRMCQPCALPYRYIGKVETFNEDARDIIKLLSVDATDLLGDVDRLEAAIRDVAQITMGILQHLEEYKKCLSVSAILIRLWKLFIYKGYFSDNEPFILPKISKIGIPVNKETSIIHSFLDMTIAKLKKTLNTDLVDSRRYDITRRMFSDVPVSLCKDIQRLLHPDAILFGYNSTMDICSQCAKS